MKERSGIYIDLAGEPVDLADVSWYEQAPCGCVSGAHLAWLPPRKPGAAPGVLIATADQAEHTMWDSAKLRERNREQGFSVFPARTGQVRDLLTARCEHVPRWGVPKPPTLDGWVWAVPRAWGRAPQVSHLVPEDATDRGRRLIDHAPLCGGRQSWAWTFDEAFMAGTVECKRCVARAEKRNGGAA